MLKFSTGLKHQSFNGLRGALSATYSLAGGWIGLYSGTQPATADAAATGTLLAKITQASGTFVAGAYQTYDVDGLCQTQSPAVPGALTLDGVTAGTLGVGYYVTISGTGYESDKIFRVTGTGNNDEDLIEYLQGPNNATVSSKHTFKTVSEIYVSAATADAITAGYGVTNGLFLGAASSNKIAKHANQVWSGIGIAAGTAGWFRFYGAAADDGSESTTLPRLDGRIATSGAEMNLSNLSVVIYAPITLDTFTLSWPTGS